MNTVQFDEDKPITQAPQIKKNGVVTRWLMDHSFGLIKTERQATVVQIAIILFGLVYIYVMLPGNSADSYPLPSEELINSPQPVHPPLP